MPKFILLAAASIDGRITKGEESGSAWTSAEDKDFLHRELDKCDAIIVGRKTYELAREPLAPRKCIVFTRAVSKPELKNPNCLLFNPQTSDIIEQTRSNQRVAVLGGTQVYNFFLEKDLIDEIYLTIEPVVFGRGKTLFDIAKKQTFRLESVIQINDAGTLVLHYVK